MKRVLVTRAANQASALADGLRAIGIEPVVIPAIEIVPPASFEAVDAALGRLSAFDWVVFTSANAVVHLGGRWAEVHGRASALSEKLSGAKVAAIGQATAKALELIGIQVDLLPEKAVAESLAEALVSFTRKTDGTVARFLLPRAEAARDVLPEVLRTAGAEVEEVAVYRNIIPEGSIAAVRELFGEGGSGVDAVTFTSGSTVTNLLALLEVSGMQMPEWVRKISIGPITSATMRGAGWEPDGEAVEATVASLVEKVDEMVLHSK